MPRTLLDGQHFGDVTERQAEVIRRVVEGRKVADLGAFCLAHSRLLLELGATEVHAIDKGIMPESKDPRIKKTRCYFHEYKGGIPSIAFVSWPINHQDQGLVKLVKSAPVAIVLSKNTDGNACGDPLFYQHLITRDLLFYEPDRRNCLIVVGAKLPRPRKPTGEEEAGMSWTTMLSYEEAEGQIPLSGMSLADDLRREGRLD
jgi:hypothetical protein